MKYAVAVLLLSLYGCRYPSDASSAPTPQASHCPTFGTPSPIQVPHGTIKDETVAPAYLQISVDSYIGYKPVGKGLYKHIVLYKASYIDAKYTESVEADTAVKAIAGLIRQQPNPEYYEHDYNPYVEFSSCGVSGN